MCAWNFWSKREREFETYVQALEKVRERLGRLCHLKLIETEQYDRSKLVISVQNSTLSSRELSKILREKYHLEMEMTAGNYILAMTSVGDTPGRIGTVCKCIRGN